MKYIRSAIALGLTCAMVYAAQYSWNPFTGRLDAVGTGTPRYAYDPFTGKIALVGGTNIRYTVSPFAKGLDGIGGGTPPPAFSYMRTLTVTNNSSLLPSTQTNFPVLISYTDATFKTVANGGHVENANGYDICFFADSGLTIPLTWEMEFYSGSVGTVIAWVRLPSAAQSTVFYMAYGNPTISTFQSTPSDVWDSNFKGVWHLPNGTVLSGADSTANANNGTVGTGPAAVGMVDGGLSTNNTVANEINIPPDTSIVAAAITIEAWVQKTTAGTGATYTAVAQGSGTPGNPRNWYFGDAAGDTAWRLSIFDPSDTQVSAQSATGFSINTWHHIVGTFDGSNVKLYADGVNTATTPTALAIRQASIPITIGGRSDSGSNNWIGLIDEVRYSNIARSADWITASYSTESVPNTFLSLGGETPTGGAGGPFDAYGDFDSSPGLFDVH